MAPREDLITSAITFLSDPSVASAPVEKRIEFLQSKNLTQEEIDLALSRASSDPSITSQLPPGPYHPQQYQRPPPQSYGYNQNPYGDWQAPPPAVPKRDWRDWFIMATVVGGASYGLYVLTQRYIKPLIAPPTPPQLEQDKAAIDEQFNRAFALLDTLSSDTTALKDAEEARTQKLDNVLSDVEAVVAELKAANLRREDESRRMEVEIKGIKDSLPRAIDSVKQGSEKQLKDLSQELGSLKTLMGNRMASSSSFTPNGPNAGSMSYLTARQTGDGGSVARSNPGTPMPEVTPGSNANVTGVNAAGTLPPQPYTNPYSTSSSTASRPMSAASARPNPMTPSFGSAAVKAAIPAWQMAAQNKVKEAQTSGKENAPTPEDGADAVAALSAS